MRGIYCNDKSPRTCMLPAFCFTSTSCESYHAYSHCNAMSITKSMFFFSLCLLFRILSYRGSELLVPNLPCHHCCPDNKDGATKLKSFSHRHPALRNCLRRSSQLRCILSCVHYCSVTLDHPKVWVCFCSICYIFTCNSIWADTGEVHLSEINISQQKTTECQCILIS